MKSFSEKVLLQLKMPTEKVPLSDEKRVFHRSIVYHRSWDILNQKA